ncbi:MAG: MCE family protein [Chlamydiae bacterium]|nr:MCE family protein [Chlamydiota bacterium]
MVNQIKNMLIGLFVVTACSLIVGIIFFIRPGIGNGEQIIKVHFVDINGINIGTRVLLAGRPIGEVHSIEQIPQARENRQNSFGQVYFYLVTLHIDSHVTIFTTDKITISTSGLLGEKQVDIIPQPLAKTAKPIVVSSSTPVYAESGDLLTSAFNELANLSSKVEETLDKVIVWIDEYGDTLGSSIRSFGDASNEISIAVKSVNDTKIIEQIHTTIDTVNQAVENSNFIIQELVDTNFAGNLSNTMANLSDISSSINQGKGTIGRLVDDDNLYIQVSAAMSKINRLMDDINNYGILFSYNKTWQRSREERLAAYSKLNNPEAFRYYIDQESKSINACLSRITDLARRAEITDNQESFIDNPDLWKNLQALKEELSSLQNNVNYYIEELNNQIEK